MTNLLSHMTNLITQHSENKFFVADFKLVLFTRSKTTWKVTFKQRWFCLGSENNHQRYETVFQVNSLNQYFKWIVWTNISGE